MIVFKDDMESAKARVEAWWKGSVLDRPAIMVSAPMAPRYSVPMPKAASLDTFWTEPAVVIPRLENGMAATWYGGEAMPVMYPVSTNLVAITCKYLGAENIYIDDYTTWSKPFLNSLTDRPPLHFDPENEWWKKTLALMNAAATRIEKGGLGIFMGNPDLNGPTEILSDVRGAQELALDFYDEREAIAPAIREVQDAWYEYWNRTREISGRFGGSFCWMGIWSPVPTVDLQSDVSCLISKEQFDSVFLDFIREQTERIQRTVYHLDGPGAIRHLDSLLALEKLSAIQWVQGAGAGPMSDWIELLRRIRDGGKPVYAYCEPQEVEPILKALGGEGVLLNTSCSSVEEGERLLENAASWAGMR